MSMNGTMNNNKKRSLSERIFSMETSIYGNEGAIGIREQINSLRNDMHDSFKRLEENQIRIQEDAKKISHKVASMIGGIGAIVLIIQLVMKLL